MGIGGFGISAVARLLHELGYQVSGCDVYESPLIPPLRELGIAVDTGHDPAHLDSHAPDALVISSAIPADQPELQAAASHSIPVYKRHDILGPLMDGKTGIAVAGTHGKTTTTAMIAYTLAQLGYDPTFLIGGLSKDLGTNARAGQGSPFVVEADEYDRMFMGLRPKIIVLTSLELDHPDMFASFDDVRSAFAEFLGLLPPDGLLIANYDDAAVRSLAEEVRERGFRVQSYGSSGEGEWMAMAALAQMTDLGVEYRIFRNQSISNTTAISRTYQASLQLPGTHNMLNALAALIVSVELEAKPKDALAVLAAYTGVERRFDIKGEAGGVVIIDDYAHHPTAIRATLQAVRALYGSRPIWAVWQPHTYSRTQALLHDFAASFGDAQHVVITDVFQSRDTDTFGITPQSVLDLMGGHPDARHAPGSVEDVTAFVAGQVGPGEVVVVMSAGDATYVADGLLAALGG
jgi:UDP-N-acetylmuramate--alanine ligase